MQDCIFCKIVKKEISKEFVLETDNFVIFKDIKPSASVHLLIVSKEHIEDIKSLSDELWAEVKKISLGLADEMKQTGYRLVNNAGEAAAIKHFHVHFMGAITADRKL